MSQSLKDAQQRLDVPCGKDLVKATASFEMDIYVFKTTQPEFCFPHMSDGKNLETLLKLRIRTKTTAQEFEKLMFTPKH